MSANPRCILPDAIIDPVSDELQAIEKLAERLRGHAGRAEKGRLIHSRPM